MPFPDGEEDLRDRNDVVEALARLRERSPGIKRAVVKLNESFAGGGNAIIKYPAQAHGSLREALEGSIDGASFVADGESPRRYFAAFEAMGGIVEEFVEGERTASPSAQCILGPDGSVRVASTHEQILGGPANQTYFGCRFPARAAYRLEIAESAERISMELASKGVTGHISIDFVCVETTTGWENYAIEVNLRMGGATARISFLESATGSQYDPARGRFLDERNRPLFYKSADRIQKDPYKRLSPDDVLEAADHSRLHFDPTTGTGSVFYMLGALATVGKLGLVAIDHSIEAADARYESTLRILDDRAS